MSTATHEKMTHDEYHAHPAIGSSQLEDFRESRREFHAVHVAKTKPRKEPSSALKVGTVSHTLILRPDDFVKEVATPFPELAPDGKKWLKRKGSDHEMWWAEEEAKREGLIALTEKEMAEARYAAQTVIDHPSWKRIVARGGEPEFAIFWTDQETGLQLKIMVDWFAAFPLDIKTAKDPRPTEFSRDCNEFGYHRKKAHYVAGIQAFTGEPLEHFLHIVGSKDERFPAAAYELNDFDRSGQSLGYRQWRKTLLDLAKCFDTDDWREPWEREVIDLSLPAYAFKADEFSFF